MAGMLADVDEMTQGSDDLLQLVNARFDAGDFISCQIARQLMVSFFIKAQQSGDIVEAEAKGLRSTDEADAFYMAWAIHPVAVRSLWCFQQAAPLVEPHCLDADLGSCRETADREGGKFFTRHHKNLLTLYRGTEFRMCPIC